MMDGWDMTGWAWAWMTLMMIIGLLLLGVLSLALFRSPDGQRPHPPQARPEEILARRFAQGEIDEEDYLRRYGVMFSVGDRAAARQADPTAGGAK
jgi:putative membrane protein